MAHKYEIKVKRNGVNAKLYYNDDGTLEIQNPDDDSVIDYLERKLAIIKETISWMEGYSVESIDCKKL